MFLLLYIFLMFPYWLYLTFILMLLTMIIIIISNFPNIASIIIIVLTILMFGYTFAFTSLLYVVYVLVYLLLCFHEMFVWVCVLVW
jgi:hypothetical protein